jgi:hypothetical protein
VVLEAPSKFECLGTFCTSLKSNSSIFTSFIFGSITNYYDYVPN